VSNISSWYNIPSAQVAADSIEQEYQPFLNEYGRNWRQANLEIPLMLALLGVPRYRRVLEIGCGRGIALPPLACWLRPARLVGVDIAFSLLCEANERVHAKQVMAELLWGDARDLPFPDDAFDVVIDFGTCFHIARPLDALKQVERVLAPGGLFVTETKLNQVLSHPRRSRGRRLPDPGLARMERHRRAWLWETWTKRLG
jgi:ubiquinone/menaquinone biosynthesis C-methylase UbiE